MWKNQLKITLRSMLKHKGFSLLNIAGLSTGLAVCFILFLWINNERSYDRFLPKADRIYRFQWEAKYGDNSWKTPLVPVPLAETLVREFPEVEATTQVYKGRMTLQLGTDYVRENEVLFVDEAFFDIFSIESLAGAGKGEIQNPEAIYLTEATAERYFGILLDWQAIIGKTIERNDGKLMQVAGIVKAFPSQSHLQFDFLAPIKQLAHLERRRTQWGSASVWTYALLQTAIDPSALDKKIETYVAQNIAGEDFSQGDNYTHFPFEAITSIHLKPNLSYLWMFGIIGGFILLLACINFINLTTARAMYRAREVGIRKVLGSSRWALTRQFFGESTLYVLISLVVGVFLAELMIPYFNNLAGGNLNIDYAGSPYVWGLLVGLFVLTALATGAIPATVLSRFKPASVIKGQFTKFRGKDRFRQALVVFQFCVSSGLIIGTLIVQEQLHFLQNKEMGFDKEQVLILRQAGALRNNYGPFLEQLRNHPMVRNVSTAQFLPGDEFDSTIFLPEQPANYEQTSLAYCHVDMDFVDALGLEIAAGRDFNPNLSLDSAGFLINQKAAAQLGWSDPVGKTLSYGGFAEGPVLGVVKDFNFASLHQTIEPLVLRVGTYRLPNIFVRLQPGPLKDQVAAIESSWKSIAPEAPFEFLFLDEQISQLYIQEQRMSSIFTVFAVLAIFIACLGLLGLAAFMAERRTKEIGIRKILGASITTILGLLSKEFLKLVVIALLLAVPLSYFLMDSWLDDFAYRISIHWWVFVLAGALAVAIALLTVSFQSLRAAFANPVDALRNE